MTTRRASVEGEYSKGAFSLFSFFLKGSPCIVLFPCLYALLVFNGIYGCSADDGDGGVSAEK